jgi:hypothetical protein
MIQLNVLFDWCLNLHADALHLLSLENYFRGTSCDSSLTLTCAFLLVYFIIWNPDLYKYFTRMFWLTKCKKSGRYHIDRANSIVLPQIVFLLDETGCSGSSTFLRQNYTICSICMLSSALLYIYTLYLPTHKLSL